MKPMKIWHGLMITMVLAALLLTGSGMASAQEAVPISLSGWFSVVWGDARAGSSTTTYTLTDENGVTTQLALDEMLVQSLGGILQYDRQYVNVEGSWLDVSQGQDVLPELNVSNISSTSSPEENVSPAVLGSKPWISIMCKFSDKSVEPENLAYFQGMYSSTKPGLDHYWKELSYNLANVSGSNAAGWFTLPHTEAYYNPTDTPKGTNLSQLALDCTAAADPTVNFANYQYGGINMMFNTDFDNGWAWGGTKAMTLDGVNQAWSITWEPPWAYSDISVIAHEMGHGFGLPHSSGNYGATYDNAWDVMSKDRYNCAAATDPTYGCMAQHTISYHKDKLGWLNWMQTYTYPGGIRTVYLERLALPSTTAEYRMIKIPIGGSATHFYTVEARKKVGYDIKLAGNGVIIHEVDTTRTIPAHVVDIDLNGNTADAGAIWAVGETFSDAVNGIYVKVLSATAFGYEVRISSTAPLYPVSVSPRGATADRTPTFKWMKYTGATKYHFLVYRGLTLVYGKVVTSGACGTTYCTNTPTTLLNLNTIYRWRIRAYVGGAWKSFGPSEYFAVTSTTGFNSSFTGSKAGWYPVYGPWSIYNGVSYRTTGAANYWSSAKHTMLYGNFTYEARMKRGGTEKNWSNTLILRGKPFTLNSIKAWKSSYIFNYVNNGQFSVWRENADGSETPVKAWTTTSAVVPDGWNTLKVVVNGMSMRFYINGTLVWSGRDFAFRAGQVGLAMYRGATSTGDYLNVDWAKLSVGTTSTLDELSLEEPFEMEFPGVEMPGGDSTQSP